MNKEFKVISLIKRFFSSKYIGDDCAYLKLLGKFAFTSDALNENVHFRFWNIDNLFFYLGYKSLWVNISDILASGSIPKYFLLNLNIDLNKFKILDFLKGLKLASKLYDIKLIGGNTSYLEDTSINITLFGKTIRPFLRNQAKEGEYIYIYGYTGEAGAGLEILEEKKNLKFLSSLEKYFIKRFFMFYIPLKVIYKLFTLNIKCAIDLSDSLAFSVNLLAKSSKKYFYIDLENFPLSPYLMKYYKNYEKALNLALYSGDDYTLLITASPKYKDILEKIGFLKIGIVKKGLGSNLPEKSFLHF